MAPPVEGRVIKNGVSSSGSPGSPGGPRPVVKSLSVSPRSEKRYHIKPQSKCLYFQDHWTTVSQKCSLPVGIQQTQFLSILICQTLLYSILPLDIQPLSGVEESSGGKLPAVLSCGVPHSRRWFVTLNTNQPACGSINYKIMSSPEYSFHNLFPFISRMKGWVAPLR